ncbi:glycosyltransferase [Verrucosispora sp. FIM060022]|uniref:glycosyltransferase family 4 protein n=1 Tax=Verrucosispora sp. FIM060022 TaxID=1479020 RepID=UPI000F88EC73|nr:glycosyltransferase [Verrucosispora sp. FIM060022]RUL92021.1 glycosyltransferase [Verrucosispora sp. FIM060022]
MRAVITDETRFARTPDGTVWTLSGLTYELWSRYLSAFDNLRIVARVEDVAAPTDGAERVDGPRVEVWPVPYYLGPRQYVQRLPAIRRAVRAAAAPTDAVLLRVPSPIGSLLATERDRHGLPYALEVIADPYDIFAPGVLRHPLRPLLRRQYTAQLRHQCASAIAAAYVTDGYLQARYPTRAPAIVASIPEGHFPGSAYVDRPRTIERPRSTTLVSVGSLEQMYKGIDTLIEAVAQLTPTDPSIRLVHVGDGRCRPNLERLAARLEVTDRVVFAGTLPAGEQVRRMLDAADLFVHPSRTEGLPRALVEAMARGLPAIGSNVGGIPELLPAEYLVAPDDVGGLASAIRGLLADPARLAEASARNLARARDFSGEVTALRRAAYYEAVRVATERACRTAGAGPVAVSG